MREAAGVLEDGGGRGDSRRKAAGVLEEGGGRGDSRREAGRTQGGRWGTRGGRRQVLNQLNPRK